MNANTIKLLCAAAVLTGAAGCRSGEKFDATGVFEATEVVVSAEASGRIVHYAVDDGTVVKAGEEVGCIDTVQLYLQKMQLMASARSVRSRTQDIPKQIAATREQIAKAEFEKKRSQNLLKAGAATQKQIDDFDSQIAVLQKTLAAQLSSLSSGNASVTQESSAVDIQVAAVEDRIRKSVIVSPIDGTVLANYAQAGELAQPGKPLFKVADTQRMYLRAYVTSAQLSGVKIGQKVRVFADYGGGTRKEYPGVVKWISDKAEFTPKTIQTPDERAELVYAVKIAVESQGDLKIGMYGEVLLGQ